MQIKQSFYLNFDLNTFLVNLALHDHLLRSSDSWVIACGVVVAAFIITEHNPSQISAKEV